MNKSALITTEKKSSKPILIVDRSGKIGKLIADKVKNEFLVVFVSKKNFNEENIVSVPFSKNIPSIPDNTYSYIILISEDAFSKQVIKVFQKKAQKDGIKLSVVLNKANADKKTIRDILDFYDNTSVLIIGDIFTEESIFDLNTRFGRLVAQAKNNGNLEIINDGSGKQSPILLSDAVEAILEAVFVEEKHRFFYIFPQNKTTLLSLALMLKKKNPNLKLDFIKQKEKLHKEVQIPEGGRYMLSTPYDFEQKVKKIDLDKIYFEDKPKKSKSKISFNFLPILVFLITLLILPLFLTVVFWISGNVFLQKFDYLSLKSFEASENSLSVLDQELNFFKMSDKIAPLENSIISAKQNAQYATLLKDSSLKINNILLGKSKNSNKDLSTAILDYKNAYDISQNYKTKNSQNLNKLISIIDYFPSLLGFYQQRQYLILFQNSSTLRPGGGLINFYAIIKFNRGKITNFKTYDTDSADKLLTTHVEPPFAIRRYLPSVNFYLKDSNFDLDFSKDAATSAIFVNSETHQAVDGVIGVDSYFIKNLLSLIGSVKVKNYDKTIDSDDFFDQVEKSTAKDFVKAFYSSFFVKIANSNSLGQELIDNLIESSMKKHIMFAFNNQNEQLAFAVNGLSSSLLDVRENSVNDFLGVSEADLGKNYTGENINRTVNQQVSIGEDGNISETTELDIKNENKTAYKNYVRFILPLNTEITDISIDNVENKMTAAITDPSVYESKKFIAPKGLELENYNESKNSIFGFLINIDPLKSKKVVIKYIIPKKLDNNNTYNLRLFKQPGTDYYVYNLKIDVADNYEILTSPSDFALSGQQGSLSLKVNRDIDLSFKIAPK